MTVGCLFCRMVADRDRVPHWVAESDRALAFLTIEPFSTGHTIVIPKRHTSDLSVVAIEDWNAVNELTLRVVRILRGHLGTREEYLYVGSGDRPDRQFPHLHLHVIPRGADLVPVFKEWWTMPAGRHVPESELISLARKLRASELP